MKVTFGNKMIQFSPNTKQGVLEFRKINTCLSRKNQNQEISAPNSKMSLHDPLFHDEDVAKCESSHAKEYI